jgi:hypothetical protein
MADTVQERGLVILQQHVGNLLFNVLCVSLTAPACTETRSKRIKVWPSR